MTGSLKKHGKALALWIGAFALAVICSSWRLFLPAYYNSPGIWKLWHKGILAIFVISLILVPTGIYRWFPELCRRRLKLDRRPWLCCAILLVEILLVWLAIGKTLHSAGNVAAAVVIGSILFFPKLDPEIVNKPCKWLLPGIAFLLVVTALSIHIPWKDGGSYATALAVGCAFSAWLAVNVVQTENLQRSKQRWLVFLPFVLVFWIAVIQHASFSSNVQDEVKAWQAGQNYYTKIRSGNPLGRTLMNIVIPLLNLIFGIVTIKRVKPNRELHSAATFLILTFVFMSIAGLMAFYCVVPGVSAGLIMPYHTCFTSLPLSVFGAMSLSHLFFKRRGDVHL